MAQVQNLELVIVFDFGLWDLSQVLKFQRYLKDAPIDLDGLKFVVKSGHTVDLYCLLVKINAVVLLSGIYP